MYAIGNLFTKEPAVIAGAVRVILHAFVLAGILALDAPLLAGISLAIEVVLTLFVRQNVYNPVTTQKIANRAAATGNTDIGDPPAG